MSLDTHTDSMKFQMSEGSSGGVVLGQSASDLLAFHGASPVAQRSGSAQAAVTALAGTLTGTIDGTIVDIAATAGSCAGGSGPTAAQVDTAIATAVSSIVTGVNTQNKETEAVLNNAIVLLNELRAAMVAKGLIAGA